MRAPSQDLAEHGGPAAAALQSLAPIGPELAGEESGGALDVDVEGVEARATGLKGFRHDLRRGLKDPGHDPGSQCGPGTQSMRPLFPQALVGVDVTDARDDPLVEQEGLDGAPRATLPGDDPVGTGALQGGVE